MAVSKGLMRDRRNPRVAAAFEPDVEIEYVLVGPPGSDCPGQVLDVGLIGSEPEEGVWVRTAA